MYNTDIKCPLGKNSMKSNSSLAQHTRHNLILERLNNGETLSISQLAKEWDTTSKTIQRDFEKLTQGSYGIIRASDGKQFTLAKNYTTSKSTNTAIKMLDSLSSDIGGEFYTKAQAALHRLQKQIESPFYTRIDVEDISKKLDLIESLEESIEKQKVITFEYSKSQDQKNSKNYKDVKPYKIIIFDGFWYLLGQYKEYFIKFYLKSINHIEISEAHFSKDETILNRMEKAVNIWFDPLSEPFDVTLLLDESAIIYFERKPIKDQYLKKNIDGTAELTLSVTHKAEIFSLLKKWLPQIRIIEPYHLQEEFEEMMKGYLR